MIKILGSIRIISNWNYIWPEKNQTFVWIKFSLALALQLLVLLILINITHSPFFKVTGVHTYTKKTIDGVKDYSKQTVTGAVEYGNKAVQNSVEYGNKAVVGALHTTYGQVLVKKVDDVLDVTDTYVDRYLPEEGTLCSVKLLPSLP